MGITAVTTWECTPASLPVLVEGSREAAPLHESMGAKNARLLRDSHGSNTVAHYALDFDSHEAYGAFIDAMRAHEWWSQLEAAVAEAHPNVLLKGTTVFYDVLSG